MSRSRLALLAVAALLVGALVWHLARHQAAPSAGGDATRMGEHTAPGDPLTAPTLHGAEGAGPRPARPPLWTLEVTVEGLEASHPADLVILAKSFSRMGAGDTFAEAPLPAGSNRVTLDVSALASEPAWHSLRVDTAGTDPTGSWYAVEGTIVGLPEDGAERARGGALRATIHVRLGALITGIVLRPDGTPAHACVQAVERSSPPREDDPRWGPEESDPADGRFVLGLDGGRGLHLNVGEMPDGDGRVANVSIGAGPFSVRPGERLDVGVLRLKRGMEQRVRLVGRQGAAGHVQAYPPWRGVAPEAPHFSCAGPDPGGQFLALARLGRGTPRSDRPDEQETEFDLVGLWPARWTIWAQVPDWGCAVGHEVGWSAGCQLEVPSGPVRLDVRRALQRVVVSDASGPLDRALVVLEGACSIAFRTDSAGHGAVVLPPGTRQRVRVFHGGHALHVSDLTTAADGEEATHLVRMFPGESSLPEDLDWAEDHVEDPMLELRVRGVDGEPLAASVAAYDGQGARVPLVWTRRDNVVTWRLTDRLLGDGTGFCQGPLPQAPVRLEIEYEGYRPWRKTLELRDLRPEGKFGLRVLDVTLEPD